LVLFAACSSGSGGGESATEVFEQSIEAAESLESAEIKMVMDQTMTMPDEDPFSSKSDFVVQSTFDPITMHQKGEMAMDVEGMPDESIEMEMYMTEDGFYLYEGMTDQWIKMDAQFSEFMNMMGAEQPDPVDQIKILEDHISDFSFNETSDS